MKLEEVITGIALLCKMNKDWVSRTSESRESGESYLWGNTLPYKRLRRLKFVVLYLITRGFERC